MVGHNWAVQAVERSDAKREHSAGPLARGLRILEAFGPEERWLANKDIVQRARLPASTVSRLVRALTNLGYLAETPRRRLYRLASPVLALGYAVAASNCARQDIIPRLQALANSLDSTVVLGERDRLDIQLVEVSHSIHAVSSIGIKRGARFPIAGTALGSALVSSLPDDDRSYLLTRLKDRYPKRWPSIERKIAIYAGELRTHGFCVSYGNRRSQLSTVVTPLVSVNGSSVCVLGCFNLAGLLPSYRVEREIGPALLAIASHQNDAGVRY